MARTTSTNFTAGLDFTLATAGTDLFKKEDVEVLAQAVDLHDHTSGKGLALPNGYITSAMIADGTIVAGDIADGAITSAKILDGTITSADIADGTIATIDLASNAVTQLIGAYVTSATFTTTTTGAWVATPVTTGSIACSGARVRLVCSGAALHSAVGGLISLGIMTDGAPGQAMMALNAPAVNYLVPFCFEFYVTPAAGSHTFTLAVINSTAGTAGLSAGISSVLYATEEKR